MGCAAGTELTEAECAAQAEYKNKVAVADVNLYPSGCWAYQGPSTSTTVYFNDVPLLGARRDRRRPRRRGPKMMMRKRMRYRLMGESQSGGQGEGGGVVL